MGSAQEQVLGEWNSNEKGTPGLTFAASGEVSGTDGCNRIVSTYAVEDERVVIEQFATTKMACQGVDTWLGGVHEAVPDGDSLHILDAQGEEIGTLQRVS